MPSPQSLFAVTKADGATPSCSLKTRLKVLLD
jgi:hypothetical protein